jgi:hypothetical protein
MLDPFPATLALVPLILYLFVLGLIRTAGFAWVTTGGRDLAAVLLAVSGLIVIGPMELFFPNTTASVLGVWVWIPLALLYGLFACLLVINTPSKVIVYGRTLDELYPAFVRTAQSLDPDATINADQLQVYLPSAQAHLRLEYLHGHDCISVLAFEPVLPLSFWRDFRKRLRTEVQTTSPPRPRRGWLMLIVSLMLMFLLVRYVANQPALLVEGFHDWLIR